MESEIVILSGGCFLMGDAQGKGAKNERPVHEVYLDSFAIGRYPVTFVEYDAFCQATGHKNPEDQGWGRGQRPVVNVSWHDANAYCRWISLETKCNYRLPTEAEWEYACRAGSTSAWCFGDEEKFLGEYAWYRENVGQKTYPVGEKKANAWGLYDMHGNVWEWCADLYHKEFYENSPIRNPLAVKSGMYRVVRGGSWYDGVRFCRSAFRGRSGSGYQDNGLGFRCVRDLAE